MKRKYTSDLKTLTEIRGKLEKERRPATILFADLADSTSYKLQRGPIDAETKIFLHNEDVTEAVNSYNGDVVKYLGDGVMAKFEGDQAEIRAVSAAVEIQRTFKGYNEKPGLPNLDKIQTRIGVNWGVVSFWELEGQKRLDPQGIPVDIASRLCDLAKPLQILCLADVKERCEGKVNGVTFSTPVFRELKGLTNPVQICEIVWLKEMGIDEVTHFSVPHPQIVSFLDNARDAEGKGDYGRAISEYLHALERDKRHFIANLMLANIYLRENKPENAQAFAEAAKESDPRSGMARALTGIIPWRINEKEGKGPLSVEKLNSLISEEEVALKLAHETSDEATELLAMNALAYYYADRYEINKDDTDLNKAIDLCKYLERKFEWIRLHRLAAFYDTYGCVLMRKGDDASLKQAKEKFKESGKLNPVVPWPDEHFAKLKKLAWKKGLSLEDP